MPEHVVVVLIHHIYGLRKHLRIQDIAYTLFSVDKTIVFGSYPHSCHVTAFYGHKLSLLSLLTAISHIVTKIGTTQIKLPPRFWINDSLVEFCWTASSAHTLSKKVRLNLFDLRRMSRHTREFWLRLAHNCLTILWKYGTIHIYRRQTSISSVSSSKRIVVDQIMIYGICVELSLGLISSDWDTVIDKNLHARIWYHHLIRWHRLHLVHGIRTLSMQILLRLFSHCSHKTHSLFGT